jgi:hypothetical protein
MVPPAETPDRDPTPMLGPLERASSKSPGGIRPPAFADNRSAKKNYAQNLSTELAMMIADCLRPHYPKARITPWPDGTGHEFTVGAKLDSKRTDVGVWDDAAGLILGVSIKTYSFRDFHGATKARPAHLGRYVRNVKRNDMELRDEADILHRRQPYAVLFALFFLPRDAAWDGATGQSSFAHAVFTFRKRTGRTAADAARTDLFEKAYIGLFDDNGAVEFFDVEDSPARNQPPRNIITLAALVRAMRAAVLLRNEGVTPESRYAPDDPEWSAPPLPEGLDMEDPLSDTSANDTDETDDDEI